jgi:hypothetical protein
VFTSGIVHRPLKEGQMNIEIRIPWEYVQYFNLGFKNGPKLHDQSRNYYKIAQHNRKDSYFRIFCYSIGSIVDLFSGEAAHTRMHQLRPISYHSALDSYYTHLGLVGTVCGKDVAELLHKEPSYPCLMNPEYNYWSRPLNPDILLVFKQYMKEIIQELRMIDSIHSPSPFH